MDKITIIVPCYNEELALPNFYTEISKLIKKNSKIKFELLFIDDGSKDRTLDILRDYSSKDKRVRYISFSRNFGKEAGIYAGLKNATGDYVVVIDADLQHPPYLIEEMYFSIKNEGYDSVATMRYSREGEPVLRSYFAKMFYTIMKKISDAEVVDGAMDYRMMSRKMVNSILEMSEYNRFTKGIFGWIGFKTKWIPCKIEKRIAGTSKWSFIKLLMYSIEGIVAFSTVPLLLPAFFGLFLFALSIIIIAGSIISFIFGGNPSSASANVVVTILLTGGLQLISISIIAQYIGKTYLETKKRPIYIEKENERDKRM